MIANGIYATLAFSLIFMGDQDFKIHITPADHIDLYNNDGWYHS